MQRQSSFDWLKHGQEITPNYVKIIISVTRKQLSQKLIDCGIILEGKVTLRSGKEADLYIDLKKALRSAEASCDLGRGDEQIGSQENNLYCNNRPRRDTAGCPLVAKVEFEVGSRQR